MRLNIKLIPVVESVLSIRLRAKEASPPARFLGKSRSTERTESLSLKSSFLDSAATWSWF